MGMPSAILERANALLEREDRQLDRMLTELASSRATLEREQREVELLRTESETTRDAYRAKLERIQERRDGLFHSMREDLDRSFQDAHAQVAAVIRDLQRSGTAKDAAHARARLEKLEARKRQVAEELGVGPKKPDAATAAPSREINWQKAQAGDAVIVRGNVQAVLATLPDRRGKVSVHVGSAKLVLAAEDVRGALDPNAGRPSGARVNIERSSGATPTDSGARGGWLECDLRGMRVHEALDRLDTAIDQAKTESRDSVRIIHGIGTGALRNAVREHLGQTQLVKNYRSPEENGGEGVTDAELA
jgi:DNA mismatch repair protein MutS2